MVQRKSVSGVPYMQDLFVVKEAEIRRYNVELEVFHRTVGHPYLVQFVSFFEMEVCSSYLNVSVFRQFTDTEIFHACHHVVVFLQVYICEVLYWPLVIATLLVVH